jgi:ribosome-binding ATPase
VIRAFVDPDVVHVEGRVDPASDIETINTELILADLQTIEKAVPRLQKEAADKKRAALLEAARRRRRCWRRAGCLRPAGLDRDALRELFLLTAKPFLYVFNVDEDELATRPSPRDAAASSPPRRPSSWTRKIEAELVELDRGGRCRAAAVVGQEESGLDQLARVGFETLGLQTYLTAGTEGVAGLDDPQGRHRAPGGRRDPHRLPEGLHQGRGRLLRRPRRAGSMAEAKARGKVRIEGKDYVMADGDVVEFRFNV